MKNLVIRFFRKNSLDIINRMLPLEHGFKMPLLPYGTDLAAREQLVLECIHVLL